MYEMSTFDYVQFNFNWCQTMAKLILAGIVVYNTDLKVLERTIVSLISGSLVPAIHLLCNSDNQKYRDRVSEMLLAFPVVELSFRKNFGFGVAHNSLIDSAKEYEWYLCCNPDIVCSETCIETLLKFAISKSNAGLIAPRILSSDGTIQPLARKKLTLPTWIHRQLWRVWPQVFRPYEVKFDYERSQEIEFVTGCFFLARVAELSAVGKFDERFFIYCEDADLAFQMSKTKVNYYVAEATVIHCWAKSWSNSWFGLKHQTASLWKYFIKNGFFG